MKIIRNSLAIVALLGLVSILQAAPPPNSLSPTMVPELINYQGRLMTPANVPYSNTTHRIVLTLYPSAAGGTNMWKDLYNVQTRDGYFSVNLGSGGTNTTPLWKVLWNYAGNETNSVFMSLTLLTAADGSNIASPVESSPRQQFLTTPFALRAHQSVYARKADALFDAPQGIQAPSLSTTNAQLLLNAGTEVLLNSDLRLSTGDRLYLTYIDPLTTNGNMYVGTSGVNTMNVGTSAGSGASGTALALQGRYIGLRATNISVYTTSGVRKPMLPRKIIEVIPSTSDSTTTVAPSVHGIDAALYDVCAVGWSYYGSTPQTHLTGVYPDTNGIVYVYFTQPPSSGSTAKVVLHLLGIPKAANW